MKKKGKKGLAVAMTLAVTMTSVPTAFATLCGTGRMETG